MALSLLQTLPLLVFFALVFCNCSGKEESVLLSESVISNNKGDGPPFADLLLRRKRGRSTFSSVFKTSIQKLKTLLLHPKEKHVIIDHCSVVNVKNLTDNEDGSFRNPFKGVNL